ncbi:uncharacterized protein LOC112089941 [Eutrema salsugineum]|uniref:uncharacterized protein LOC112089941 n=1 Tax=Eutrema salsugineum TaxID=72664 RepID=UPI000CED0EC4|nr:uncharacterized protein LOC112089941 [Eutrema salsugineum]
MRLKLEAMSADSTVFPGRWYYKCLKYLNEGTFEHIFQWWDDGVTEQLERYKIRLDEAMGKQLHLETHVRLLQGEVARMKEELANQGDTGVVASDPAVGKLKEERSGQNDDDLVKAAHQIFFSDHQFKFGLEHCWRELRHDQKWCTSTADKDSAKKKRRKGDETSAHGSQPEILVDSSPEARPPGVKAAKAAAKKKVNGDAKDEGKKWMTSRTCGK